MIENIILDVYSVGLAWVTLNCGTYSAKAIGLASRIGKHETLPESMMEFCLLPTPLDTFYLDKIQQEVRYLY